MSSSAPTSPSPSPESGPQDPFTTPQQQILRCYFEVPTDQRASSKSDGTTTTTDPDSPIHGVVSNTGFADPFTDETCTGQGSGTVNEKGELSYPKPRDPKKMWQEYWEADPEDEEPTTTSPETETAESIVKTPPSTPTRPPRRGRQSQPSG
ncbi:hypothetical protein OQA88_9397 [Cercophora sp. LCS_1]